MRKVILFNMMTLDGFFEGPNHDINWHNVDEEFNQFAFEQLNTAEGLIFGRTTYELMASYWPTPDAIEDDPVVADWMNKLPKFVFSRTLLKTGWHNTTLINGDAVQELTRLKQLPGKDLFIFGSADLAQTFFQNGLIDEIRVIINPLLLGNGTPQFKLSLHPTPLKLVNTRIFANGNVLLIYQVLKGTS